MNILLRFTFSIPKSRWNLCRMPPNCMVQHFPAGAWFHLVLKKFIWEKTNLLSVNFWVSLRRYLNNIINSNNNNNNRKLSDSLRTLRFSQGVIHMPLTHGDDSFCRRYESMEVNFKSGSKLKLLCQFNVFHHCFLF